MDNSLPALPILSDLYYDTMEITNRPTMQVGSAGRGNPVQMHCMDQEDKKTLSWEWNLRGEHVARSELEAVERDACCALFHEDQPFKNRCLRIPQDWQAMPSIRL